MKLFVGESVWYHPPGDKRPAMVVARNALDQNGKPLPIKQWVIKDFLSNALVTILDTEVHTFLEVMEYEEVEYPDPAPQGKACPRCNVSWDESAPALHASFVNIRIYECYRCHLQYWETKTEENTPQAR